MRQPASPEGVAGTQPHVTVRVRIWLRKKAARYTITLRFFKYLRPPRRRGGLDVPKTMQYPQPASTSWRSDSAGNVTVKSAAEQESMRVAGRLASQVLDMIGQHVVPGVSTEELDRICHDYIVNVQDAIPAPLGYRGYPKSICTSVNHVVCHGIPGDRRLKQGDFVNIDVTVIKDGFHGDTSRMYAVGRIPPHVQRLVDVTYQAMWLGLRCVRAGTRLGDIGATIQRFVEGNHYSVVREYCGHGIGRGFHEDPQVLHYGVPGTGMELVPGMTFTIEPMVNAGRREVRLLPDGWTVVTRDHSLSAQWEHTVLVTETGFEVLTLGAQERPPG
jgi:methionyl aminopeptidase